MEEEKKICKNCKQSFTIFPDDKSFYARVNMPIPSECPWCRTQYRLMFWPFGKFNKRTCDLSGDRIISLYPAGAPFPVYKNTEWYSDKWQAPAMAYDPNRPFFDQLSELQKKTPRCHQLGSQNTACDWCDDVWESKNCYLCRSLLSCENLSYSYRTLHCRDSYDLCYCFNTEQSYDCVYAFKAFNVRHAFDVRDSMDSAFIYDCRNVRNCFMCWNLRNKEYCIKNNQYSKEEYNKKIKEYHLDTREGLKKAQEEFESCLREETIHRATFNTKCVNSTGNYLTECKACRDCYFWEESENCAYSFRGPKNKDVYDGCGILEGELIYNVNQSTGIYRLFHSNYCTNCRDSEYLDFCFECENCFGCVGLRNKSYCILNKQYSESEYKNLVKEIKDKMIAGGTYGNFLPLNMACGGYNLSVAGVFFPKTKDEVESIGAIWEKPGESGSEGRNIYEAPNSISEVGDDIIGKALICPESKRAFSITAEELAFLRKHNIPLPLEYPDVRTLHRIKRLFCIFPHQEKCHFCGKEINSYYPKEFGYKKIACDDCYLKEVV